DSLGNMYACGNLGPSLGVAKWNGIGWTPIPTSNALTINSVGSLATDKEGNLYISGNFTQNGLLYGIAKWDGSTWTCMASGYSNVINFVIDPGTGVIYATVIYFANYGYNVIKIDGDTITNIGNTNSQRFQLNATDWMTALALDAGGNLYVAGSLGDSSG